MLLVMWLVAMLTPKSFVAGNLFSHISISILASSARTGMSRVKFPTHTSEWVKCMEMCPKYERAIVPSFTTKAEMDNLITWLYETTTDPISGTHYPDVIGKAMWLPFREVINIFNSEI